MAKLSPRMDQQQQRETTSVLFALHIWTCHFTFKSTAAPRMVSWLPFVRMKQQDGERSEMLAQGFSMADGRDKGRNLNSPKPCPTVM